MSRRLVIIFFTWFLEVQYLSERGFIVFTDKSSICVSSWFTYRDRRFQAALSSYSSCGSIRSSTFSRGDLSFSLIKVRSVCRCGSHHKKPHLASGHVIDVNIEARLAELEIACYSATLRTGEWTGQLTNLSSWFADTVPQSLRLRYSEGFDAKNPAGSEFIH